MMFYSLMSLLLLPAASQTAVDRNYFDLESVHMLWEYETGHMIGNNNGVFEREGMVYSLARDCHVAAINGTTGEIRWEHDPLFASTCTGGIEFHPEFILFVRARSSPQVSIVTGLRYSDGETGLTSSISGGEPVGTPRATADGKQIMLTSNLGDDAGAFYVIEVLDEGKPPLINTYRLDSRLSAIGSFQNPLQGNYMGGYENSNDIFVFGNDRSLSVESNATANQRDGQIYAFQLPQNSSTVVGGPRSFRSGLPPVLSNNGLNMYWSTSSELRCWIGESGLIRYGFDQSPRNTERFRRNDQDRRASALAPPTVGFGGFPSVYGPTASNQVFRVDHLCTNTSTVVSDTPTVISTRIVVAPDNMYIYYATSNGTLIRADGDDLSESWALDLPAGVEGDMAQSTGGQVLYVGDVQGRIRAYQIADLVFDGMTNATSPNTTIPTGTEALAPTFEPVANVTAMPTSANVSTVAPIMRPTVSPPSAAPTANVTTMPPTLSPTVAPTAAPTTNVPTIGPSVRPVANTTQPTLKPSPSPVTASPVSSSPTAPLPTRSDEQAAPTGSADRMSESSAARTTALPFLLFF